MAIVGRPGWWAALAVVVGCGSSPPIPLDSLLLRDSTYVSPDTHEPFTGRVVRFFDDDPERPLLEGALKDGLWEGELTVYHASGRIRYQGRLAAGAPCGAWVENREDEAGESVYQLLMQEIESMGLYPPCPDG